MEQQKSDFLSLSEARALFAALPVPYMGQVTISEQTLGTLRAVVDRYIVRNQQLETKVAALEGAMRGLQTVGPSNSQSPEAAFTTLQQFEREQGNLVQVVATAQEEARIAKAQLRSAELTIKGKDKTLADYEARIKSAVEDYDIQYAANKTLVEQNRRYQQETMDALQERQALREEVARLKEQQPRQYPPFPRVLYANNVSGSII